MALIARQHWSAKRYAEAAGFVPALGAPVLALLAPSPGELILDLGCGDGELTEKMALQSWLSMRPSIWSPPRGRGGSMRG